QAARGVDQPDEHVAAGWQQPRRSESGWSAAAVPGRRRDQSRRRSGSAVWRRRQSTTGPRAAFRRRAAALLRRSALLETRFLRETGVLHFRPRATALTRPNLRPYDETGRAEVAELADAPGSGPGSRLGSGGSSPLFGTLQSRVHAVRAWTLFRFLPRAAPRGWSVARCR